MLREVRAKDLAQLVERLRPLKRPPDRRPAAGGRPALGQPARRRRPAPGAGRPRRASTASRCATGPCARGWCWRRSASRSPPPPSPGTCAAARSSSSPSGPRASTGTTCRPPASPSACSTSPPRSTASATREREWLEYAALLHDLGYSIHYRGHHKHAYYLITNAVLDAFDQREIEIIAHVARYHRGAAPKASHPTLAALKPWQQRIIRKLAALLRVADSLDRTHASRVEEIYCAIAAGPQGHPGGALPLRRGPRARGRPRAWPLLREGLRLLPLTCARGWKLREI